MFESLKNKKYLLTGGSGHLGKAISKKILDSGGKVIFLTKNRKKIIKMKFFKKFRKQISIYECDLLDRNSLDIALNHINKNVKFLNGIVNMAAYVKLGDIENQSDEDMKNSFQVNIHSTFQIIKETKNLLKKGSAITKESSSIVNISSMYGIVIPDYLIYKKSKFVNSVSYGCSKASLIHLSKYIAADRKFKNIRINSISPGAFPNINSNFKAQIKKTKLINKIPLRRFGKPDEIVGPVVFLLSNYSSYVNGANLVVDGGFTIL